MSKKLLFRVLVCLVFVATAGIWLASKIFEEEFDGFNTTWLLAIIPGCLGVLFILKGLFQKNIGTFKKLNIFFGAGLLIACMFAFVGTFIEEQLVWPIIAVVITVAILLSVLAVGGKSWDEADNQKVGYKNYYQRKAEKEKEEQKNNK